MKRFFLILLILALCTMTFAEDAIVLKLSARSGKTITIEVKVLKNPKASRIDIFRSTSDLNEISIEDVASYPIVKISSGNTASFILNDNKTAHKVQYYYIAAIKGSRGYMGFSNVLKVATDDKAFVTPLRNPCILVDKTHYLLILKDGAEVKKVYPIALGRDPVKRKLHQDNSTTPEGIYRIYNVQPRATYYRAFDLNYPNIWDRGRYSSRKAADPTLPHIGGEIQIHGLGIGSNWTFGCIAMRNKDIDELMDTVPVRAGTPVCIIGQEIDLKWIEKILALTKEQIMELQRELKASGHYNGAIDGLLGPKTARALFEAGK
ncbi:L,D-transpeptidase family protein [bacterium]|nr:L,D-transpeptidase family protein [bacterium]